MQLIQHFIYTQRVKKNGLKWAPAWLHVLTLSYSEQVAEICGGHLGGWWLEALYLTQHEVIVGRQV